MPNRRRVLQFQSPRQPGRGGWSITEAGAGHARFTRRWDREAHVQDGVSYLLDAHIGRHLGVRSADQERNRGRWYGRCGQAGRRRRLRRENRRDWRSQRQREANHRRGRLRGGAGLHRSAHSLRRADFLGCGPYAVTVARGDQCRDGQLRGGHRAVPDGRPRDRHARSRQCRSHSLRRAANEASPGNGRPFRSS